MPSILSLFLRRSCIRLVGLAAVIASLNYVIVGFLLNPHEQRAIKQLNVSSSTTASKDSNSSIFLPCRCKDGRPFCIECVHARAVYFPPQAIANSSARRTSYLRRRSTGRDSARLGRGAEPQLPPPTPVDGAWLPPWVLPSASAAHPEGRRTSQKQVIRTNHAITETYVENDASNSQVTTTTITTALEGGDGEVVLSTETSGGKTTVTIEERTR